MKKMNKKGFTLAELLIVVAIIAVLVAIAIPVFNAQLEKSRDSVSISNLRAAYAQAAAEYLTWGGDTYTAEAGSSVTGISEASGVVTITVKGVDIKSQSKTTDWSGLGGELPFTVYSDPGTTTDSGVATFTYTISTGTWACTGVAAGG